MSCKRTTVTEAKLRMYGTAHCFLALNDFSMSKKGSTFKRSSLALVREIHCLYICVIFRREFMANKQLQISRVFQIIEVSSSSDDEDESSDAELRWFSFIISIILFMFSSSLFQPLSTLNNAVFMFLSAQRLIAWERGMAGWCVDTWILAMQSRPEIFTNMPRFAGVREL